MANPSRLVYEIVLRVRKMYLTKSPTDCGKVTDSEGHLYEVVTHRFLEP